MQRSRTFWEQIVSEYNSKGSISKAEFCNEHGVKRATLDYWRRKIRDEQSVPHATTFVRVGTPLPEASKQPEPAQMRIRVGNTMIIEVPLSVERCQLTEILQAAAAV